MDNNYDNLLTIKELSDSIGVTYKEDISSYQFIVDGIKPLPYSFVSKNLLLPIQEKDDSFTIAISNPYNLDAIKEARFLLKKPIKEILTTKNIIEKTIELLYFSHSKDNINQSIESSELNLNIESNEDKKNYNLFEDSSDSSIISLLNKILINALQDEASDIHFEPTEKNLIIRYRIDGILFEKYQLPKSIESQIISRLKVQAELDIAESRMPQDGRIKLMMGKRELDFRLSTVPVIFGERLVLRILDSSKVICGLDQLNMKKDILSSIRSDTKKRQGIILVTGPTGSGKTTTLYSALSELSAGDLNIMTIEDPVEYKLQNIAQININHKRGLTFSKGLKHILRQDPDIIMIGEIRDRETVEIAIEASLNWSSSLKHLTYKRCTINYYTINRDGYRAIPYFFFINFYMLTEIDQKNMPCL